MGEKTAGRAKPYRLEKGDVHVGVHSHAWAQELHYRVEEIKTGLKKETGLEIGEIIIKKINLR